MIANYSYTHRHSADGVLVYQRHTMRVTIISYTKTKKSARVRLMECHADGSQAGAVVTVRTSSLFPLGGTDPKANVVATHNAGGYKRVTLDPDDIKKPYKD